MSDAAAEVGAGIGEITAVKENVVEVSFLEAMPFRHELLTLIEDPSVKLEVYSTTQEGTVYTLALSEVAKLYRGAKIRRTGEVITIPVGSAVNGRLINVFGDPQDKKPLKAVARRPIYTTAQPYTELKIYYDVFCRAKNCKPSGIGSCYIKYGVIGFPSEVKLKPGGYICCKREILQCAYSVAKLI